LSAVLKLDWQPPTQLPVSRSSLANFAESDVGAAAVIAMAGDVRDGALRTVT
jgi:hypothetical protein